MYKLTYCNPQTLLFLLQIQTLHLQEKSVKQLIAKLLCPTNLHTPANVLAKQHKDNGATGMKTAERVETTCGQFSHHPKQIPSMCR